VEAVGRILGEVLAWLVIALMAILTAVVVVAVVYRKAGASLSWYDEVASGRVVWITYYGAARAALKRSHIGVDNLLLALPPPARRVAVVLAEFFVILFFVLLAWAGWRVLQVLSGMSLISLTWVPVQFTQSVIPIGAVLFILAEIISLPTYWRDVMSGRSAEFAAIEHGHGGDR
jgi:TRAP-type C4-dicarboxylate transport system permease small subunit